VPAGFTGEPLDYYLGIIHVEKNRAYLSFFYKMLVRPPALLANWCCSC
jgi:hypothetical protein